MKLLLTSAGITNDAIKNSLLNLAGKGFNELHIAFIETASNPEIDKSFLEKDYKYLIDQGTQDIMRIDFSKKLDEDTYNFLENCDVIWMAGGNTFYLLNELRVSGFGEFLTRVIENKVYVGVSAGSIVATSSVAIANVEPADENVVGIEDFTGLCWVNFEISPHTPEIVSLESVEKYSKENNSHIFAFDDKTALELNNGEMVVVSEGFWQELGVSI
ncbi:Type 1 glutamine amidotransferase-like domain-containing protein [candidate division WWE3 bacterium]|nr:Type 1 glutamine amidotransferase-like domain-containing protein [candidate division WWE3 bacterium]